MDLLPIFSSSSIAPPSKKNKTLTEKKGPPPKINLNFGSKKKKINNKRNQILPLSFFSLHGNSDTIHIGQEIQCLQFAGNEVISVLVSYCPIVLLFFFNCRKEEYDEMMTQ